MFILFLQTDQTRKAPRCCRVGQCLVREYRMVCYVMQGKLSRDFFEVSSYSHIFLLLVSSFEDHLRPPLLLQGCRAILWDKDKYPKVDIHSFSVSLVSQISHSIFFINIDCCLFFLFHLTLSLSHSGNPLNWSLLVTVWLTHTSLKWMMKAGKI